MIILSNNLNNLKPPVTLEKEPRRSRRNRENHPDQESKVQLKANKGDQQKAVEVETTLMEVLKQIIKKTNFLLF